MVPWYRKHIKISIGFAITNRNYCWYSLTFSDCVEFCFPSVPEYRSLTKKSGKQRHQSRADQCYATASHELLHYGVDLSRNTQSHCNARISSRRKPEYKPIIIKRYGGSSFTVSSRIATCWSVKASFFFDAFPPFAEIPIGASFDEVLAPQIEQESEIVERIQRLVLQCSHREQELLLALIDKMLDTRGKPEKESPFLQKCVWCILTHNYTKHHSFIHFLFISG